MFTILRTYTDPFHNTIIVCSWKDQNQLRPMLGLIVIQFFNHHAHHDDSDCCLLALWL